MFTLKLKKNEDRRVRAGHCWIFSNEIAAVEGAGEAGGPAEVFSASGRCLGTGTYNRASLIACRLFSRQRTSLDRAFFEARVRAALEFRQKLLPGESCYRLIFSEGDGLPGLVVDRFGDALVLQVSTAGADRLLSTLLEALEAVIAPRVVVLRNDSPSRALEGLDSRVEVVLGALDGPIDAICDGLTYRVDLLGGQKTGFYFDQRENRRAVAPLAAGARVLDLFCYTGSWALEAARAGAANVVAVDSSGPALALAAQNAKLNGFEDRVAFRELDVTAFLDEEAAKGHQYDLVLVDPPPYARSKKDLIEALVRYERLNRKALAVLATGGYLVSSSCSYHVGADDFARALSRAASTGGCGLRLVEWRGQARDHPGVLAMPETRYLKCAILQKV